MPVRAHAFRAPEAITFERDYRGTIDQAQHVRADLAKVAASCPVLDDLVLLASELSANAILHSRSGHPDRTFTVRVTLYPGDYAWGEVIDQGGTWTADEADDEHGRGLTIVAAVAGEGNWGIDGGGASRVAWFRLNWHQDPDEGKPARPRRAATIPPEQAAVVGVNIRTLRQRRGWSQAKLGELMGWLSASTVCAAEGRRGGRPRDFTVREVERLATIFGVSPGELTTRCANCYGQPPTGFACLVCGATPGTGRLRLL